MLAEMLDTSFHSADELRAFTHGAGPREHPRIVTEADRQQPAAALPAGGGGALLGLVLVAGASYFVAHGNEQLVRMLDRDGS